jgi:DNA-binding response OmpR family regulator
MAEVGLDWVTQGKTTLVEVERVLGKEFDSEGEEADAGPARVLLVDDDPEALLLGRTLLEQEGFVIAEAKDGFEALEILKRDPNYSLCVLDLTMPGMDGRELLGRIRGSVDTAALPVLIRTGTGDDQAELELLDAGADDYLDKASQPERFVARVKAVLRRVVV